MGPLFRDSKGTSSNGKYVTIDGIRMGNEWVSSYNPYLLKRFKCHINVAKCNNLNAVKYLYKYVYKGKHHWLSSISTTHVCRLGYDKTEMTLTYIRRNALGHEIDTDQYEYDEITRFLDFRYLGPCEAAWRIFEFPMQGRSHHVERLPIHLGTQWDKAQVDSSNNFRERTHHRARGRPGSDVCE